MFYTVASMKREVFQSQGRLWQYKKQKVNYYMYVEVTSKRAPLDNVRLTFLLSYHATRYACRQKANQKERQFGLQTINTS